MDEVSQKYSKEALTKIKYDELISSNENLLEKWTQEKEKVDELLLSNNYTFDDIRDFIVEKLSCHGCSKHQGYIMSNFQLDSTMAAKIFLDNEEFVKNIKPDYVIVINRSLEVGKNCQNEDLGEEKNGIQQDLRDY